MKIVLYLNFIFFLNSLSWKNNQEKLLIIGKFINLKKVKKFESYSNARVIFPFFFFFKQLTLLFWDKIINIHFCQYNFHIQFHYKTWDFIDIGVKLKIKKLCSFFN